MAKMQEPRHHRSFSITRLIRYGWVALSLLLVACHVDMYDQPRYEPYEYSAFFADGRSSRPPIPNTVAVGQFQDDPHFLTGMIDDQFATTLPFPLTADVMERGRQQYNAFCMSCHGLVGDGDGLIAQRGPLVVTSFHSERLRNVEVGYIFDVITNGLGRMYSHAARIPPEDRWAITAYVRALQLSQDATLDDLSPEERERLVGTESEEQ